MVEGKTGDPAEHKTPPFTSGAAQPAAPDPNKSHTTYPLERINKPSSPSRAPQEVAAEPAPVEAKPKPWWKFGL